MEKLKTITIQGKEYVTVNERLQAFRNDYPNYALESNIISLDDNACVFMGVIKNEEGRVIATGTAREVNGSSFINKTSYVENCETSAWGRALGNFGYGLDTSVASAEEVANAIKQQEKLTVGKKVESLPKTAKTTEFRPLLLEAQGVGIDLNKLATYYKKDHYDDLSDKELEDAIAMKTKGVK